MLFFFCAKCWYCNNKPSPIQHHVYGWDSNHQKWVVYGIAIPTLAIFLWFFYDIQIIHILTIDYTHIAFYQRFNLTASPGDLAAAAGSGLCAARAAHAPHRGGEVAAGLVEAAEAMGSLEELETMKIVGKSWENHGKIMEHLGKIMGKIWEIHRKIWETDGKRMEHMKIQETHGG